MRKAHNFIDLTNKRFNRLKVLCNYKIINGHTMWQCICVCGNKRYIDSYNLRKGFIKSCGCYRNEKNKTNNIKHGMHKTRFYKIWSGIVDRCNNNNSPVYNYYGNRNINVLWKFFEEFRDDMHRSYKKHCKDFGTKNTSIDRINNDGNYCKGNCRWATMKEQASNRRNENMIWNKKY